MKKIVLVLSVLGMGIAQSSGAAYNYNSLSNPVTVSGNTISNIPTYADDASSRGIHSTNSGAPTIIRSKADDNIEL